MPDGSKYVGQFRRGSFSGQGRFTWANGQSYKGNFKQDKFHGKGT